MLDPLRTDDETPGCLIRTQGKVVSALLRCGAALGFSRNPSRKSGQTDVRFLAVQGYRYPCCTSRFVTELRSDESQQEQMGKTKHEG